MNFANCLNKYSAASKDLIDLFHLLLFLLLSLITLIAAIESRVPNPFLKSNWSGPRKSSDFAWRYHVKIFSKILEPWGIKLPVIVLKSTHSLAPCFFTLGVIMDSVNSLGQWVNNLFCKCLSRSQTARACSFNLVLSEFWLVYHQYQFLSYSWVWRVLLQIHYTIYLVLWYPHLHITGSISSFDLLCICLVFCQSMSISVICDICWPPVLFLCQFFCLLMHQICARLFI